MVNFPTSLDNFTNPTGSDNLDTVGVVHSDQHANINDAVEALEAKVGINSSVVTSSIDYKVNNTLVPYTGASGDVDLGTHKISEASTAITGTGGSGYITLVGQSSNPSSPAAGTLLIHSSTTQGFTRMEQDNEATTNLVYGRDLAIIVKNTSGGTLTKGTVVHITGSTGNVPNVAKAKADSSTTLPASYVIIDDIADNAFGQVMRKGIISGIDTSAFTSGDRIYISPTTAGAITNVRPSGTTNYVQRVGTVLVSGVGNGSIEVDVAPAILNMETGTTAATWTGSAVSCTTLTTSSNIELGNASDTTISRVSAGVIAVEGVTVPTISSTNVLTNKSITKRVITTTDDSTAVIDVTLTDVYELSAIANDTTFSTTGTPVDGQQILIRFKDAGVSKNLTWDAIFVAIGVTLPSATTAGKWHYIGAQYNSAASKFHVLAAGVQA